MKYLALIYSLPNTSPSPDSPEFGAFMAEFEAVHKVYAQENVLLAGEALLGNDMATTVRVRDGKTETMDGPYIESKEQLGGFYLFDCENLDEALKYAAMIPVAKYGTIELRTVEEF